MKLEEIGKVVMDSDFAVHRELGPGLLESAYEHCLAFELVRRRIKVECQKELPLIYRGVKVDAGYRIDLLIEQQIVVELKAIERIEPIHKAQLISYLKLSGLHLGFLINFNTRMLRDGLHRLVYQLPNSS
ncbi:MAG: GxxExxY protein [Opitutaceae bacterium]